MTASETSTMIGNQNIEIKLRDVFGQVDSILITTLKINKSILPTLPFKPEPEPA